MTRTTTLVILGLLVLVATPAVGSAAAAPPGCQEFPTPSEPFCGESTFSGYMCRTWPRYWICQY